MLDKEIIRRKLVILAKYLDEINPLLAMDNRAVKEDRCALRAVERLIQLIVDTAIDINTHIISEKNFGVPEEYRGTFDLLGEHGVLPSGFTAKIGGSVGLRNAIVHQYEKVDVDRMLNDIRNNLGDYTEYILHIRTFAEAQ